MAYSPDRRINSTRARKTSRSRGRRISSVKDRKAYESGSPV
jgi:hypothetical protein